MEAVAGLEVPTRTRLGLVNEESTDYFFIVSIPSDVLKMVPCGPFSSLVRPTPTLILCVRCSPSCIDFERRVFTCGLNDVPLRFLNLTR